MLIKKLNKSIINNIKILMSTIVNKMISVIADGDKVLPNTNPEKAKVN